MKKILKLMVILALLGVIALVAIGFFIGPIVVKAVNTVAPRITGTPVTLDAAKVSPLTGGGTLAGLFVGNPTGWTGDKALYFGEMRASIQPTSLLSDCIVVNEVFIDGPEFVFEKRLMGGSNIESLLKQIETNTGGGTKAPEGQTSTGKPLKFAVKSFKLQNAKMELIVGGQTLSIPLPPLTITDLGVAEGGITTDQLAVKVLQRVLAQMGPASVEAVAKLGAGAVDGGGKALKGAGEAAKGTLNKLFGK